MAIHSRKRLVLRCRFTDGECMGLDDFEALPAIRSIGDLYRPIAIGNPAYLIFWLSCYASILYFLNRSVTRQGGPKSRLVLWDYWSAVVAFVPAFILLLDISDDYRPITWSSAGYVALTFLSAWSGSQAALLLATPLSNNQRKTEWARFLNVVSGASLGFVGLFFTGFLFEMLRSLTLFLKIRELTVSNIAFQYMYHPIYILFWFAISVPVMISILKRYRRHRTGKLRFYITDYWAAIIALLPTFMLLTCDDALTDRSQILLLILSFIGTCTGIWAGLLLNPAQSSPASNSWRRRLAYITGCGLAGGFGVYLSPYIIDSLWPFLLFAWFAFRGWLMLCYLVPPLFVVSIICFKIHKKAYDLFVR